MSAMEGLNRRSASRERLNNKPIDPITDKPTEAVMYDRSLADITQNKFEHELFYNEFLPRIDPARAVDVAYALAHGHVLPEEDDRFLEKARKQYNKERFDLDRVQDRITKDEIVRIGKLDKRIGEIVGKIGPYKAAELIKGELPSMAMSEPKTFRKLLRALTNKEGETAARAKELDERVEHDLHKYGIGEDEYVEATATGTTIETRHGLQQLVKRHFRWYEKAFDFVSAGTLSAHRMSKLYDNLSEEERLRAECDDHLKKVGKVLRGTLNADVREAMQKYTLEGGTLDTRAGHNLRSITDLKNAEIESGTLKIRERFEEAKKKERARLRKRRGAGLTPAELNDLKDNFSRAEFDKQRGYKGRGMFSLIFNFIFGARTPDDIKRMLH